MDREQRLTCAGDCLPIKRSCCSVRSTVVCFWKFCRALDGPQSASAMLTERIKGGYHRMLKPEEMQRKRSVTMCCSKGRPRRPRSCLGNQKPRLVPWRADVPPAPRDQMSTDHDIASTCAQPFTAADLRRSAIYCPRQNLAGESLRLVTRRQS